jgi:hypothetical protein
MPDISTINAIAEDNIAEWNGDAAADVTSVNGNTWIHALKNYFGDATDGDVTISSNTSLAVTEDAGPAIVNYSTLTVNGSTTLTTDNRCKGLVIYVTGNCTINGTISMTARGGKVSAAGYPLVNIFRNDDGAGTESGTPNTTYFGAAEEMEGDTSDNVQEFRAETSGGAGGGARDANTSASNQALAGSAGSAGGAGATGGGGSGGAAHSADAGSETAEALSGAGANGTTLSGGPGGGGTASVGTGAAEAGSQGTGTLHGGYGGRGSARDNDGDGTAAASGGAGNPGGSVFNQQGTNSGSVGTDGTGGLIWLIVGGNLTLGSGSVISADGSNGGNATAPSGTKRVAAGGGGSGGGRVVVIYAGTLTNNGTIRASGGSGGSATASGGQAAAGGAGGAGTTEIVQVNTE